MYNRDYIQHYDAMQNCIYTATNKCQYDPYLMHYGVLGMKWGQHLFGKLTGSGKKSKSVADTATGKRLTSRSKSFASRVQRRMQIQQANKIKSAQKTLGLRDESGTSSKAKQKARVLKSRSAKELYKHADLFTYEELDAAYKRLNLERSIKNLEPKNKTLAEKWIDSGTTAIKLVDNAQKITNTGIGLYNGIAAINNSLGSGKKMTMIATSPNDKKNKADDD
jgi:hypothetical protein